MLRCSLAQLFSPKLSDKLILVLLLLHHIRTVYKPLEDLYFHRWGIGKGLGIQFYRGFERNIVDPLSLLWVSVHSMEVLPKYSNWRSTGFRGL